MFLSMSRTSALFLTAAAALTHAGSASAQEAAFPFFESFEGASLSSSWTVGGYPLPVAQVSSSYFAFDGAQVLELGTTAVDSLGSATADLSINLLGQSGCA